MEESPSLLRARFFHRLQAGAVQRELEYMGLSPSATARGAQQPPSGAKAIDLAKRTLVLDDFLPYRLSVASNAVSQLIARSYEETTGLRTNEWRLIAVLAEDGELSQQGLVRRTKMDKVSVSRAATGLADRGLVRRLPDPADARSLLLTLTPAGKRLHARLSPKALSLEARLVGGLPPEKVALLEELLLHLEQTASRLLDGG